VFEQLARNDDVEALVAERQRLVDVGPTRLDAEARRVFERFAVDVDADDLVPGCVLACQRAVAAAEVEHAPSRTADVAPKEVDAIRPCEDEILTAGRAVVLPVTLAQLLEPVHAFSLARERRKYTGRRMSTKPVLEAERPVEDIRSARPYLLSRRMLLALARRLASIAALVTLDVGGVILGVYAALIVRALYLGQFPPLWGLMWRTESDWLPFLTVITVLVFWVGGLYRRRELRPGLGQLVKSLTLVAVITLAFGVGTGYHFTTYGLTPTALVLTALFVGVLRASYETVTADLLRVAGTRRRAVLVGEGERLASLLQTLGSTHSGIAYEFLGAISPRASEDGLPVLGSLDALPRVLAERDVHELIVTDTGFTERQLLELVEEAHRRGVKVRLAPTTTELLLQRAEYVPGHGAPLFELRPPALAGADWALKRAFDIVGASIAVVLGSPLWLAIAVAIKATSRGPVFYRDRRVGLGEQEFGMMKFRTMYADAAERQAQLEAVNEASGPLFKIKNDPRVTPVGRFLRRFSLDETPQVLNVLWGEMSLVGPRPLPVRDYEQLEPWHRKRYAVLPGMTGLWQVSGRIDLSFDDLVRLDFYYLENWSIWLDISILAKTLPAVLARRGAY
jgi:exopolysaccharide biosynthesis polyprenyl glycosylphosphotransferase